MYRRGQRKYNTVLTHDVVCCKPDLSEFISDTMLKIFLNG